MPLFLWDQNNASPPVGWAGTCNFGNLFALLVLLPLLQQNAFAWMFFLNQRGHMNVQGKARRLIVHLRKMWEQSARAEPDS